MNEVGSYLWETVDLEFVAKFVFVYIFIIWIVVVFWVAVDIYNRTNSFLLQMLSVAFVTFLGPIGILLYLLVRPNRTLAEKYYGEIDENLEILAELLQRRLEETEKKIQKK